MKIVSLGNNITTFNQYTDIKDMNSYVKKIVLYLKKRYKLDISGFYKAKVYINKKIAIIVELIKEEAFELFDDLVDLDIEVFDNSNMWISFDDYFFLKKENCYVIDNKYYIDLDKLDNNLYIFEFGKIVYGKELDSVKKRIGIH